MEVTFGVNTKKEVWQKIAGLATTLILDKAKNQSTVQLSCGKPNNTTICSRKMDNPNWRFPKSWGTPCFIHFDRNFHEINDPAIGDLPFMETLR
jgi:Ni,Fe-hydrogenase I small subunit